MALGKLVVVEGHVLLCSEDLVGIADAILFLAAAPQVCKRRRIGRKHRTREEMDVLERYFDKFVVPAHESNVLPFLQTYAEQIVIVDNSEKTCLADVVKTVTQRFEG